MENDETKQKLQQFKKETRPVPPLETWPLRKASETNTDEPGFFEACSGLTKLEVYLEDWQNDHKDDGRTIDVDQHDQDRKTPLFVACAQGRKEVAKLLLDYGADEKLKCIEGWTPLFAAAEANQPKVVDFILSYCGTDTIEEESDDSEETPLCVACRLGHVEVAKILLRRGANTEVECKDGMTPLCFASKAGKYRLVMLLVARGVFIDATTKYEQTALHLACESGRCDVVDVLLDRGAPINARSKDGASPLIAACREDRREIVELLLNQSRHQPA